MKKQKIFFTGLDFDSDDRRIGNHLANPPSPAGSYKDAINVRIAHSANGKSGVMKNIKGTVLIPWNDKPAGTLTCIGTLWDEKENTQIGFFYNTTGAHCIARYYPKRGTYGEVETVLESSTLNFVRKKLITGAKLTDGKYLSWTDYENSPRFVNIEKANLNGKKACVRLYFRKYNEADPVYTDRAYNITLTDGTTTAAASPVHITSPSDLKDFNQMIRRYVDDFNGNVFLNQYATAEACADFVKICFLNEGDWKVVADHQDFNSAVPGVTRTQNWVYENRYHSFTDHNLALCFWPWNCSPTLTFKSDTKRIANLIDRTNPQFAIVYHGWDARRSVLSGYSNLAVDDFSGCGKVSPNNCIEIDFSNPNLVSQDYLSNVEQVEIVVRFGNNDPWKSVTILDHADFIYDQTYKFYNDGTYPNLDPAYAAKVNEAIPLLAKSLEVVSDNENNTRLILGGLIEGYDNFCPDVKLSVTYDSEGHETTGHTIEANIYIINKNLTGVYSLYQPIHDLGTDNAGAIPGHTLTVFGGFSNLDVERGVGTAHKQWLPLGGFVGYLAGTSYYGISEQNDVTAPVGGGTLILDKTTGNVFSSEADGIAVNPLNRKGKAAIRYMIENTNGVFSRLQITGVPEGDYVFRIASHWTSYNDELGKGTMYDLNDSSRAWQGTSTYLDTIGGAPFYEVHVTVPAGTGTISLGDIEIEDLSHPGSLIGARTTSGYVIDNDADTDDTTLREEGIRMEKQLVVIKRDLTPHKEIATDHNGFFYSSDPNDGLRLRLGVVCPTGNPAIPISGFSVPNINNITNNDRLLAKDLNQLLYEGGLDTGVALISVANNLNHSGAEHKEYILPNNNQDVSDILKTSIEGFILDSNNDGVSGIPVVFAGTGRTGLTGSDGSYKITVWADGAVVPSANERSDLLIPVRDAGQCIYDLTPSTININIPQFDLGASYSRNVPFVPATIIGALSSLTGNRLTVKRRASYYIGLVYYDNCGGRTVVNINEKDTRIYIPGENEDLNKLDPDTYPVSTYERGRPSIQFSISHDVPRPAVGYFTHYRFVRSLNTLYNFYLQWVASTVQYVERYDTANSTPITTSYGSGTAREIYLNIGNNLQLYQDENADSILGYVYSSGDRIRFILNDQGNYFDKVYDLPIQGQIGDDIIIEALPSLPEIKAGVMFEIYTPKLETDERLYYETNPCYEILNPTTNPTHSVTTGTLEINDAYWRRRQVIIEPTLGGAQTRLSLNFENENISDFYISNNLSIGRINIEDHKAIQQNRDTAIRISNPYLSGTSINGLGEFEGLNIKELNKDYGLIQKLSKVGDVLVSICTNRRTVTTYMGKSEVKVGTPQGIMTVVDQILGTVYELAFHAGTLNPESFVEDSTFAYWVDRKTGTVVRYTVNGIHPLESQYYAKSEIPMVLNSLDEFADEDVRIYGTFDRFHREYIFSVEGVGEYDENGDRIRGVDGVTYVFHEGSRDAQDFSRFTTKLSAIPEFWGRQELRVLSYKNGDFYLHNEGPVNEFYGVVRYPEIEIVANEEPDATKIWESISLNSYQDGWEVIRVTNGEGQLSLIPAGAFRDYEGTWRAPFFRDSNTQGTFNAVLSEGKRLRSKEIVIRIKNTADEEISLNSVDVYYRRSPRTNR